jgi:hypothetical protein
MSFAEMLHSVAKQVATNPVCTIDGKPRTVTRLEQQQLSARVPTAMVTIQGGAEIAPGTPIAITLPGGMTLRGAVAPVVEATGPAVTEWQVSIRMAVAKLDNRPVSKFHVDKTRDVLLKEMLAAGAVGIADAGQAGVTHKRFTLLSETLRPVCTRLALLGGRVLLLTPNEALAVDPASPGKPVQLPAGITLIRRRDTLSDITLIAPHADKWGHVIRHNRTQASADRELIIRLPEAVDESELAAAADAIHAIETAGSFTASGGSELLGVSVGSWMSHPRSKDALLITGRTVVWSPHTGWHVELLGGYPLDGLSAAQNADSEPAEVVGFEQKTGLLKLRLPAHGIETVAGLLAARASGAELVINLPRVGDHGIVVFGAGYDQAVYLGAVVPSGALNQEEFDGQVQIVRTEKLKESRSHDGKVVVKCEELDETIAQIWREKVGRIAFDKYSG